MKLRSSAACAAILVHALLGGSAVTAAEPAVPPVPPSEHPRLYLRAAQVAELPARLNDPVLQPVVQRLERNAARPGQFRVEWRALKYLAHPDAKLGRATIGEALGLLQKCELPNRQDACRYTGRMMVTGALVYDWLYPLLTSDEKQAFVKELVRLAKTQECGYPPDRGGSITGHTSEAMIMRDMISAGVAIYDEFPEMYRLAAGRFFREHLPARNWFYPGNAYHQGDSYGPHRYSWDTFPLFIFDRLGAGNIYNPQQRFVPYLWVYTTRPDGQRLRAGDTFKDSTARGQPWNEFVGTLFTASYYHDGVLLSEYLKQGGSSADDAIFEFLWRDAKLQPKPIETLPLSRYFGSPFGWMVARTGWGDDAVIVEMKINEYNFVNHQHLDAGAFQIYYHGALALDSGNYEGGSAGGYGSSHTKNYSWRTVAHNSLLVDDPAEKFANGYENDGGQRFPNGRSEARTLEMLLDPKRGYRTGRVLGHGFGPDAAAPSYTILQGDLTDAYSKKVTAVRRSFIFLNFKNADVPAALVTLDRVVSAVPTFRKSWLLHTQEEPRISGPSAIVDRTEFGARGRLQLDVLAPRAEELDLAKIGGPGKEFWAAGRNWTNDVPADHLARSSKEMGAWRIELSPKAATTEDVFFAVMQVTDREKPAHWKVERIESQQRVGCVIEAPDAKWVVSLRRDSERSVEPVRFAVGGPGKCHVLVADLGAGAWQARRGAEGNGITVRVAAEDGVAWFEGETGDWTLTRDSTH